MKDTNIIIRHFSNINIFFFILVSSICLLSGCGTRFRAGKNNDILDKACIIIDERSPPSVRFAASELSHYLYLIFNKRIPISNIQPKNCGFTFLVGKSNYTDSLGITHNTIIEDIIIKGGDQYLALIGVDTKFAPQGPINLGFNDIEIRTDEWDKITNNFFEIPLVLLFKNFNGKYNLWENEKMGTLKAVYQYLEFLGVRWYMPGEIGEVVPKFKKFKTEYYNYSHKASFPIRSFNISYNKFFMASDDMLKWILRLKPDNGSFEWGNAPISHGLEFIQSREEMKRSNKDIYALLRGKREIDKYGSGLPCLSSRKLKKFQIEFLQKYFDTYNESCMSIMPGDGFGEICQCNECTHKDNPERGRYGIYSNYVWNYVNNISREIKMTHPDKYVSCLAYTTYLEPPTDIKRFEGNLKLGICYPINGIKDTVELERYATLITEWKNMLTYDSILIYDYFLYTDTSRQYKGIPVLFMKYIEQEIQLLKRKECLGKFIEISSENELNIEKYYNLAFEHLNIYITSKLLWNSEQSTENIINEYYELFYGPASKEVNLVFNYIENNWRKFNDKGKFLSIIKHKLLKAQKSVKRNDIYYNRIQMQINFISNLD